MTDSRLEKPLERHRQQIWSQVFELVSALVELEVPDREVNFDSEEEVDGRDPDGVDLFCETALYSLQKQVERIPLSDRNTFWSNLVEKFIALFRE